MAAALPFVALAGAALQTFGDFRSDMYQAAVLKNNSRIAERNADIASTAAQLEQQRSDLEYGQLIGQQLAAQGASGLDIMGRTQRKTRETASAVGREAAMDIRQKGAQESQNYLQEAANLRGAAREQKVQGYINLAGNLLNTASAGAGGNASLVSKARPTRRRFES